VDFNARNEAVQQQQQPSHPSWLRQKLIAAFWTVVNLLRTPAYAVPLVINLTGSVWFFLLVGKHGLFLSLSRGQKAVLSRSWS
jgi:hypothetical protein